MRISLPDPGSVGSQRYSDTNGLSFGRNEYFAVPSSSGSKQTEDSTPTDYRVSQKTVQRFLTINPKRKGIG